MRKYISVLLSFFLIASAIFPIVAEAAKRPVAVYYVPHQGDEQTILGASMVRHAKTNDVHVVLLTKPSNKAAFIQSVKKMGVKENRIHFSNLSESNATIGKIKSIMQSYEKKYPNARHKTTSYISSDHIGYNAGVALLELFNAGKAKDTRYYVDKVDLKFAKKKWTEKVSGSDTKKVKITINYYHKPNENKKPVAVFYVPHQDDELLNMGVAIINHVQTGTDVHLVLLTDGSSSNAIHNVNKKLKSQGHKTISRNQMSDVRDTEFTQSAIALGVQPSNVHFGNLKDGQAKVSDIKKIMLDFERKYPNARHKTMSYIDDHHDHAAAGKALLQLNNERKVKDARFYIQHNDMGQAKGKRYSKEKYTSAYHDEIVKAASSYKMWSPSNKRYAVGYTSVKGSFDRLVKTPESYYHLPNF